MNDDLSAATEIEFYIDTPTQIKKTLSSSGGISAVTATQFSVQIDAADTETVKAGPYKFQSRATIASKKHNIKHTPNQIKILDSILVTQGSGQDYGG